MVNRRVEDDGEKIVGKKIGVTSKPVQDMLGVFQPDFGFLTDAMEFQNDAEIKIAGNMIQPRAEAEIAFRLKKDLAGPGVLLKPMCSMLQNVLFPVLKLSIPVYRIGILKFRIPSPIMPPVVFMCWVTIQLTLEILICPI